MISRHLLRDKKENDIDLCTISVAFIGAMVTLISLTCAVPSAIEKEACLPIFGLIVLASLASAAVFGGITYGIAYMWSKLSGKVDEVDCKATPTTEQRL